MPLETERKYLDVDFAGLRMRLSANGAVCEGTHFEKNFLFDTSSHSLVHKDCIFRLRVQENRESTQCRLTFKSAAEESTDYKIREELETKVDDGAAMYGILRKLGYRVVARYEKIREVWRMGSVGVFLDTVPFAEIVELEGQAGDILAAEHCLHLDKAEISTKSYHELHQAWLMKRNRPQQLSFVFSEQQRSFWRKKLGLPEKAFCLHDC